MATQNSINKSTESLTVNPSSGDSYIQHSVAGVSKWRTGNDSTDDSYRISTSTLGSSDSLIMTSSGERTLPLQPAFLAYLTSAKTNVTGDGTAYDVIDYTEIFDQGNDFNTVNGNFIAPISGRYLLSFIVTYTSISASNTAGNLSSIQTSNRIYYSMLLNYAAIRDSASNRVSLSFSTMADLDAGDGSLVRLIVTGGTKTVGLFNGSSSADPRVVFSGSLIC